MATTSTKTSQMLKQACGEDCLGRTRSYERYERLTSGGTSTEDDPGTGRPSSSTDDGHVEKVPAVIRENRCETVREVSEEVGISKRSCHTNFDQKSGDASCCCTRLLARP
jgi:hypothetical protein